MASCSVGPASSTTDAIALRAPAQTHGVDGVDVEFIDAVASADQHVAEERQAREDADTEEVHRDADHALARERRRVGKTHRPGKNIQSFLRTWHSPLESFNQPLLFACKVDLLGSLRPILQGSITNS